MVPLFKHTQLHMLAALVPFRRLLWLADIGLPSLQQDLSTAVPSTTAMMHGAGGELMPACG
jgi:hypothetical protein